jgi:hypothetical protein
VMCDVWWSSVLLVVWWWVPYRMLLLLVVVIYIEHHSLQNVTHQFEFDFLTNSLLIKTFPKFIIATTKEPNRIE